MVGKTVVSTERLPISAPGALERARTVLAAGGLVVFPTDTVYGVGAHALQQAAVARLYAAKVRPLDQAVPLLLADARDLGDLCVEIPGVAWALAERFWPGPLSLVLFRSAAVPDLVTASGATVAVRVPAQEGVRELCRLLGAPLAATSANLHGRAAPVEAGEVSADLGRRVELILDGGRCPGGTASTVLDLTSRPPRILRVGPVTQEELRAFLLPDCDPWHR